ncbi:MAG: diaminopimelate epimerase [Lentisphaeraceae bacterium]|nr:diaminopimelate epimerase [Lentisphaeraceae bacterium]
MRQLPFTKMHGTGNDFIVLDALEHSLPDRSELAKQMCSRRFAVGADQFIIICPSEKAQYLMEIYNPDGSQVEMCGNALRAVALYIRHRKNDPSETLAIETAGGITYAEFEGDQVKINMGAPSFAPQNIGLTNNSEMIGTEFNFTDDIQRTITCVSMGNPHCVQFVDSTKNCPLESEGPIIENHSLFANRTNVEFIEILSKDEINMRVWERGTGETLACGSGACGAVAAAIKNNLTNSTVKVNLLGGILSITWDKADNCIYMTGPATFVFDGVWQINE